MIILSSSRRDTNQDYSYSVYTGQDGDNIWKGLRISEVHKSDHEMHAKCHNGQCHEFLNLDQSDEKYFSFGSWKIAFMKTRPSTW